MVQYFIITLSYRRYFKLYIMISNTNTQRYLTEHRVYTDKFTKTDSLYRYHVAITHVTAIFWRELVRQQKSALFHY